jgi:RHS repeat-associated protein
MVDGGINSTLYHDADDEQVTDPGGYRNYAYNANGDQITYYDMGQPASTFSYDPEDRLVGITYGGGGGVTFSYDALGRQVARTAGGVTTSYYYDGDAVIDEYNGTSYAQYTWGPGGQVRRGSEFTLYDGLGSVTKITDGSGTPTEQITFDAFGREQNVGGSSSDPYQYKSEYGYRTDGDGAYGQGITKVGARYYDPLFGRFITRDKDLGQSPYAYCGGDPVNFVDPSGFHPKKKVTDQINPDGTVTETTTITDDDGSWTTTEITYDVDGTPISLTEWSSDGSWTQQDWFDIFTQMSNNGATEVKLASAGGIANTVPNPNYAGVGVGSMLAQRNPYVTYGLLGLAAGGFIAQGIGALGQYLTR